MGRVVVITGSSSGIGAACARRFKQDGWSTIGIDRQQGSDCELDQFIQLDLARPDTREAISSNLPERVDALVNNAAIQVARPLLETTPDEWQHTFDVNVRAAALMIQAVAPLMPEGSAVVNIGSVHAAVTSPGLAAYAASKGAIVALTRAAALELACKGIRVNAVLPGAIDTPMLRAGLARSGASPENALRTLSGKTPLGRAGRPEEIAEAILVLADESRSSFITGQTLTVDGGATARLSTE